LRKQPGSFVRVRVSAIDAPVETWTPVDAYFRRTPDRWTLVGIDRQSAAVQPK
jgi:hypothetical protein